MGGGAGAGGGPAAQELHSAALSMICREMRLVFARACVGSLRSHGES